jgi:hypothetical protein
MLSQEKRNATLDQRLEFWPSHLFSNLSILQVKIMTQSTLRFLNGQLGITIPNNY